MANYTLLVISDAAYRRVVCAVLLFLIYVNDLSNCLRAAALTMFADETNITLLAKTLADLKQALSLELSNLSCICWLKANKRSLNATKAELMVTLKK